MSKSSGFKPPSEEAHDAGIADGSLFQVEMEKPPVFSNGTDCYAKKGKQFRTGYMVIDLHGPVPFYTFHESGLEHVGSKLHGMAKALLEVLTGDGPLSQLLDSKLSKRAAEIRAVIGEYRKDAPADFLAQHLASALGQDKLAAIIEDLRLATAKGKDGKITEADFAALLVKYGV